MKTYEVRYVEIVGRNWTLETKEKSFKTEQAREKFVDKLADKGRLHDIIGYREVE